MAEHRSLLRRALDRLTCWRHGHEIGNEQVVAASSNLMVIRCSRCGHGLLAHAIMGTQRLRPHEIEAAAAGVRRIAAIQDGDDDA